MVDNFKDEVIIATLERTIKRLWILNIILILLLAASNAAWIYYESQFEDVTTETVEQDVDTGDNNGDTIVNGIGDINGKDKTKSNKN